MKKRRITAMIMSMAMLGISGASPFSANAVDENAADSFAESTDSFFVVVGTYNIEYTQLRYYYTRNTGVIGVKKVVMTDSSAEYNYGDILVTSDEPELTEVNPYANVPVYSHASFYELSEETELSLLGSCAELMPQKELTMTRADYGGSGYWDFRFTDEEGAEYRFGLNYVGTHYGVDLTKAEVGDVYTFAMVKDTPVLALEAMGTLEGDANTDGAVTIADPVAILQHIANRDKYELRPSALVNADVDGAAGVTANDARVLQEWDANK